VIPCDSSVNLVLIEPSEILPSARARIDGPRAAHLLTVLKVSLGADVRIGVLDGPRGVGTVEAIADGAVTLRCAFEPAPPPLPRVDLLLALPRPKVMRRLWAQLAALGVGQIILTNAERVERNYFDTHALTPDCYRPLLVEGLQQARDTRVPHVSVHRQFKVLIEDQLDALFGAGRRLVADPAATRAASAVLWGQTGGRVLLAVGPEGGWNDFERQLLVAHGFAAFSFGQRTLRSDTACIALLAVVHEALGAR
jgi:RsmE family RNA methyltransferase